MLPAGTAFVTCLDGVGKITIDGTDYLLHEGESIVMPAGHPHAVVRRGALQDAAGRRFLSAYKVQLHPILPAEKAANLYFSGLFSDPKCKISACRV